MSLIGLTVALNTYDITIIRGDDQVVRFTVTKSDGTAQDVTGWSFKFTVKDSIDDAIGDAKFQKTTGGGGIALTTPLSGIVDVTLASADTAALAGPYTYDLEGQDGTGARKTVRLARFTVRKDVSTPGGAGTPSGIVFFIDGVFYIKDATTGLYGAFRLNNTFWEQSPNQSATIPFTF